MNFSLFMLLVGGLVIGVVVLLLMFKTGHSSKHDIEENRLRMKAFDKLAASGQESDRHMAIVKADSLLGSALVAHGVAGNTMGERMKKVQFSNADSVWSAHKLRNRIAHESEVKLSADGARRALYGFKQAMKDLGAL